MISNKKTARDASYYQTSGALLLALKEWASIPEQFPYGTGVLILNYLLYQSELVPRWLSVWGLIGGVLILAMGVSRLFGRPVFILAIPIILNEMVLAVWLIAIGINLSALASTIVGLLIITALVSSMLNGVFIKPINTPDYLTAASANDNKVSIGVLFQLTLTASVVAIPIVLFPILREHSESLALGYVGARIFEGFFDAVIAISQVSLLALSREFVKSETPTAKTDINETE
jgi:hypothetical protein